MLFSTLEFLFLFLPACLLLGLLSRRVDSSTLAIAALLGANLFFYAWFHLSYLPLLIGSIVVNYALGHHLIKNPKLPILIAGIVANLVFLGFYKYGLFFTSTVGLEFSLLENLILPLAISFYTFQQISFIVDCKRGQIDKVNFLEYALYVSFFPQLIAGPIVRFSELYPQIRQRLFRADRELFALGLTLFIFGLGKKTLIADVLARPVDAVWAALPSDAGITSLDAWFATFAYSFQIYFDFSAYSDMAIGLGLMMGLRLPVNFLSPYRAASIREFWQCWHMTLSRWLRDYLYITLGGNRHGRTRQIYALFITMALGGLWHGAGWNFIIWGIMHGLWIACSHLWQSVHPSQQPAGWAKRLLSQVLTFGGVTLLWVLFRGEHGQWLSMMSALVSNFEWRDSLFASYELVVLFLAAMIAFFAPANAHLFKLLPHASKLKFTPNVGFAIATAIIFLLSVVQIIEGEPNAFIYFQF